VVAGLDVALEADLGADRQQVGQRGRRLGPEALHGLVGVHRLGRVDADQPHGLDAAGDLDLDGVAVDHRPHHAAVGRARAAGAGAGAPAGGEERGGHHQRQGAEHGASRRGRRPFGPRRGEAPTGAGGAGGATGAG
jgi:hypothetical protein